MSVMAREVGERILPPASNLTAASERISPGSDGRIQERVLCAEQEKKIVPSTRFSLVSGSGRIAKRWKER